MRLIYGFCFYSMFNVLVDAYFDTVIKPFFILDNTVALAEFFVIPY